MFAELAPFAEPDRNGLANLRPRSRRIPSSAGASPTMRAALVRTTIAITMLQAGTAPNVVPEKARRLDVRLLPGRSLRRVPGRPARRRGRPSIASTDPLLRVAGSPPTRRSSARSSVAADVDAGARIPRVIAGFTDAHYFRDLGIVSYGFVPRWLPPSETRGIHGPNERVSIDNLERGIRTTVRILEEIGR
jgi:carboxypeptidase PM20D1